MNIFNQKQKRLNLWNCYMLCSRFSCILLRKLC